MELSASDIEFLRETNNDMALRAFIHAGELPCYGAKRCPQANDVTCEECNNGR